MRIKRLHAEKKPLDLIPVETARSNKLLLSFTGQYTPVMPNFIGQRFLENVDLATLVQYIDWRSFFPIWDLRGIYPAILDDPAYGETASKLYADAKNMLEVLVQEKWLTANASFALLPANSINEDDIEIYTDESRQEVAFTYYGVRQQIEHHFSDGAKLPNLCLADFIAPKISNIKDYIGLFAITTGIGIKEHTDRFEAMLDDYSSIMLKALADCLAEAFSEYLHERIRKDFWGYAPHEQLSHEELLSNAYQGIRPAPGYPPCPEHTVKANLFSLLKCEQIGISLTESFAMFPASSISGFYFSHPDSRYFSVGRIDSDQVQDMAKRRGVEVAQITAWLTPIL
jgi:5-methyltetrahydrofolate--homocysteine methyltransferase